VGLISENRKEWLLADLGLLAIGAADVPRGCDTMAQEMVFILKTVEAPVSIFENVSQLKKVVPHLDELPKLKTIILFDPPEDSDTIENLPKGISLLSFTEVLEKGKAALEKHRKHIDSVIKKAEPDDLATIIFTSGTTGEPKGVMISHWNFLSQALYIDNKIGIKPGDIWLCVLPVWHSFERVMQYISIANGTALAYSKPIGRIMLADFQAVRPTWMASVPRIWESLRAGIYSKLQSQGGVSWMLFQFFVNIGKAYKKQEAKLKGLLPTFHKRSRVLDVLTAFIPWLLLLPLHALGTALVFKKIRARLGGRFVAGISGGGALPPYVDDFFSAAGILLLEGYGLTESSPVISVRTQWAPIAGTIGSPLRYTFAQVRGEDGRVLPPGQLGVLYVKGDQIMKGYYKREDLTKQVIGDDGWLNTGDLAMMTHKGEIAIRGRAKDTIVLMGGENIEPAPIEARLKASPYIDNAVLLGQDQKFLGALIVPDQEAVCGFCKENGIDCSDWESVCEATEVHRLIRGEVNEAISSKNGFRTWEQISRITIIPKSFEVGQELSGKQDIKRHVITEQYKDVITKLFK
jgi:long-chain acyl-CoA synthetase